MLVSIFKALVKCFGARKTADIVTSKPAREIAKKIVKHEIDKKLR